MFFTLATRLTYHIFPKLSKSVCFIRLTLIYCNCEFLSSLFGTIMLRKPFLVLVCVFSDWILIKVNDFPLCSFFNLSELSLNVRIETNQILSSHNFVIIENFHTLLLHLYNFISTKLMTSI